MRVVVQRARQAKVTVDGKVTGAIEHGLMLLVGITHEDTVKDLEYCAKKVANLRIFEDEQGKMNLSIKEVGGSILSISQFTLYGETKKGNRPSFIEAARPEVAEPLYHQFNQILNYIEPYISLNNTSKTSFDNALPIQCIHLHQHLY